ncbi:MAG: WecB/TagA/CpsF family glycosyltransferase, partial [Candidatus Dormibacteraeota bacterium]|nr:WecB/TagA/CpsF family glycosyltransferase [Candidatus Dormibacteraeota bacterium]
MDRLNVLGVGISAIDMENALGQIDAWINSGQRQYICVCPVHTVMECFRSPELKRIVNSGGMATPDGMPLVWLARLSGRRNVRRVYGPDLMLAELNRSIHTGYKHFLYGGRLGVVEELARRMRKRFEGLNIVGTHTPPMADIDDLCSDETAQLINRATPDIVWIGIGSPKQEFWMSRMRSRIDAPVLIGVGAAFDFHAGVVRQAPRFVQRSGFEWLFRLSQDPRRLWRRYLSANTRFLYE